MTSYVVSYPLKLEQKLDLQKQIKILKHICFPLMNELLLHTWSEETLQKFNEAKSSIKSYKILGEEPINQISNDLHIYLPSRMKRAITEQIGRIIRSQLNRQSCWFDIIELISEETISLETNLDTLVKVVFQTLKFFNGKFYKYVLIRQHLRMLRKLYFKTKIDLHLLANFRYTQLVKPSVKSFLLPYSVDEGNIIKINLKRKRISVQLKLPLSTHPKASKDWKWYKTECIIPDKLFKSLKEHITKIHLPSLRLITLKGGLELPFLEFPFEKEIDRKKLIKQRIMTTDLGLVNLSSSVIFHAGEQISRPIYYSANKQQYVKIDKLYRHIYSIQHKLTTYKPNWFGQKRRKEECNRLLRKRDRIRQELLHSVSNHLINKAQQWQVETIVLEDLRSYEPPKTGKIISRKLSEWFRGSLYELLVYKGNKYGIKIERINPKYTSSYCPRCGCKGHKIRDPKIKKQDTKGRFFSCPNCSFMADRDYNAALNIYRVFLNTKQKKYTIFQAPTVTYKATVPHLTVSNGNTQGTNNYCTL